jgi:hypothetical protein
MVIALVALVFSFTGGAGAIVHQITGGQIKNHSLTGADIRDRSLNSSNISVGGIHHINISGGSVHTDDIADGAVTTDKLADGAVTADKMADAAITSRALGRDSVSNRAIAPGAVTGADLAANSVGARELAPDGPITYVGDPGAPSFQHGATQPRSIVQFHVGAHEAKAGFYKDVSGNVHLVGAFNFVPGSTAFVLPPDYRPSADLTFGGAGLLGDTNVRIGTDGSVGAYPVDSFLGINLGLEDLVMIQGLTWRPGQEGVGG